MSTVRSKAIARSDQQIDESQQRAIAAREERDRPRNALEAMAARLQVSPAGLKDTLMKTVFSACRNDAEFIALTIVSNEYGLNPLTKEIYAFPAKGGGIVPMVSVDGWIRIMNEHPQFDGIEFDYIADQKGNIDAIESIIHRKDRSHPIKVIEYLDECRRATDPWKNMPRRMLRNRALIQGARIAFGFSGLTAEGEEDMQEYPPTREATRLPTYSEDQDDGDVIDQEDDRQIDQETGEVRDAGTGMTEVDEETARQLDAEQAEQTAEDAPEQGEAPAEDDPKARLVATLKRELPKCETRPGVEKWETEWLKHRAAYDDDTAAEVDGLIQANRKRVAEGS